MKVTIIMATYNRAHFIEETLKSIQNQTFSDWECLIIDDGGTDNTQELITPILEKDPRFQFLKRPDIYLKGLPGCRNYGLDLAKGEFIIFFDDDDIVHPDILKISLNVIENEKFDFCHYQKQPFQEQIPIFENKEPKMQQTLNLSQIDEVVTQKIGLASCTVLWNKNCFKNIRFNEKLLYAEEWECYSRIITEGFKGVVIDNVLYFNRKHPNSNTGEFFNNNPIRKKSKADAILLVVENLKSKGLLSEDLLRYFIQVATNFRKFRLFQNIVKIAKISIKQRLKWYLYYRYYAVRLYLYRLKRKIKS